MTATRSWRGCSNSIICMKTLLSGIPTHMWGTLLTTWQRMQVLKKSFICCGICLPNKTELAELKKQRKEAAVPQKSLSTSNPILNSMHPMAALRTAISLLGLTDGDRCHNRKRTTEKPSVCRRKCRALSPLSPESAKDLILLNRRKSMESRELHIKRWRALSDRSGSV